MSTIRKISIQACRGFLERREIPLSNGKRPMSVCVLGDNGTGKSSVGDAIEFFFAPEGVVARFGKKQTDNLAGASAIVHARAAERKLRTEISFELSSGDTLDRSANSSGGASAMPAAVEQIIKTLPCHA